LLTEVTDLKTGSASVDRPPYPDWVFVFTLKTSRAMLRGNSAHGGNA